MAKKAKMEFAPLEVVANVEKYLKENFGDKYKLHSVYKKSVYPDDNYLYMVIAKVTKMDPIKEAFGCGPWTCWTCWNESTQCMNHGHYDLATRDTAYRILREHFYE